MRLLSAAPSPALCAVDPDPETWFADPVAEPDRVARAQALCHSCPMMAQCQTLAPLHEFGVWGGVLGRVDARAELEERQIRILRLDREGFSFHEIAKTLGVSRHSVRWTVQSRRAA